MSSTKNASRSKRLHQRIRQLREAISTMEYVASGTLHTRTKRCGRKNCRCAEDPAARHGPYHEWSRREDGRLVHTIVTQQQAYLLDLAIQNYRKILALLTHWRSEATKEILDTDDTYMT